MNTAINALLLAAGVFFAASILATAFNSNELRKGVELLYMNRFKRITNDYLKKCQKTIMEAFEIGFRDGKSGSIPNIHPLPPMEGDKKTYALCLFAQEMYKDGYRVGSVIKK